MSKCCLSVFMANISAPEMPFLCTQLTMLLPAPPHPMTFMFAVPIFMSVSLFCAFAKALLTKLFMFKFPLRFFVFVFQLYSLHHHNIYMVVQSPTSLEHRV